MTPFLQSALAIIRKDVQAELRSRELIGIMGVFSLLSVLIFSFALELNRLVRLEAVSGALWVTIIFASILGLNRSMAMEREGGNLDALLIAPIARASIFAGKLLGNFVFTLVVSVVLLPVMTVLYGESLINGWLIAALLLGTFGFASIGTLLAAMTAQTRAREALLPVLMLPIALPVLLTSVRATTAILNDLPQDDWLGLIGILLAFDIIYTTVCFLGFEFVVED